MYINIYILYIYSIYVSCRGPGDSRWNSNVQQYVRHKYDIWPLLPESEGAGPS